MDGFHSNTTFVADMSVGIWLTAKDLIWRKFLHFGLRNNESEHLPMGKNANMSVLFVNECSVLELRDAFNMIWEMELEEICLYLQLYQRSESLSKLNYISCATTFPKSTNAAQGGFWNVKVKLKFQFIKACRKFQMKQVFQPERKYIFTYKKY